jgi:hypothetical protein
MDHAGDTTQFPALDQQTDTRVQREFYSDTLQ